MDLGHCEDQCVRECVVLVKGQRVLVSQQMNSIELKIQFTFVYLRTPYNILQKFVKKSFLTSKKNQVGRFFDVI